MVTSLNIAGSFSGLGLLGCDLCLCVVWLAGLKSGILSILEIFLVLKSLVGGQIASTLCGLSLLSSDLSFGVVASFDVASTPSSFRFLGCDLSFGVVADLDITSALSRLRLLSRNLSLGVMSSLQDLNRSGTL